MNILDNIDSFISKAIDNCPICSRRLVNIEFKNEVTHRECNVSGENHKYSRSVSGLEQITTPDYIIHNFCDAKNNHAFVFENDGKYTMKALVKYNIAYSEDIHEEVKKAESIFINGLKNI